MQYNVTIPCTMSVAATVEAESEAEAIDKAMNISFTVNLEPYDDEARAAAPDVVEWEMHRCVTEGNVYNGVQNEVYAEEA